MTDASLNKDEYDLNTHTFVCDRIKFENHDGSTKFEIT